MSFEGDIPVKLTILSMFGVLLVGSSNLLPKTLSCSTYSITETELHSLIINSARFLIVIS